MLSLRPGVVDCAGLLWSLAASVIFGYYDARTRHTDFYCVMIRSILDTYVYLFLGGGLHSNLL